MIRDFIDEVWATNRSLITEDHHEALTKLSEYLPDDLVIHSIPTGEDVWTWTVPERWNVHDAYISDGDERIIEYDHPLRIITYSESIDRWVSREELIDHVYLDEAKTVNGEHIPRHPEALPYIFKFYDRDWGFCLRESEFETLKDYEELKVHIDTTFEQGEIRVGEYTIEGNRDETILFTAHLDHPAQVNDDLAGVAVGTELMNRLEGRDLDYTYTFLVAPETIGSIAFFSRNENLVDNLLYGIYLEMLGTDGSHSLQRSFQGDTTIDQIAETVLQSRNPEYTVGEFRRVIGNDEMVTNGPGMRVPTISLSRWPYDEYHTSYDSPEVISEENLINSTDILEEIVALIEHNITPKREFKGPLFLSGHGLWEAWGGRGEIREKFEHMIMHLEGDHSVLEIADMHDLPFWTVFEFVESLYERDLVSLKNGRFPKTNAFKVDAPNGPGEN